MIDYKEKNYCVNALSVGRILDQVLALGMAIRQFFRTECDLRHVTDQQPLGARQHDMHDAAFSSFKRELEAGAPASPRAAAAAAQ